MTATTRGKVLDILAELMAIATTNIQDGQKLVEDLGCDSLDLVEVQMAVEETWNWTLSPDWGENLGRWTVGELVADIDKRLARQKR